MKLIDKDVLVAEIEKRRDNLTSLSESCPPNTTAKSGFYAQAQTLEGILSFLNTLEVKEVDLEKEYEEFVVDDPIFGNFITNDTMGMELAKHFFELGLKVKQESNDCMEYEIPKTLFKDGDNVEILIRKAQKGKNI